MLASYDDLFALAARLGEVPRWFDENGTPRFCDHHPDSCPDIYAREVALLLIACQRCGTEIRVQMSTGLLTKASLFSLVEDGTIHYGDPPTHEVDGQYCHAGCTMNCYDLRVLEFWRAPTGMELAADVLARADNPRGWKRVPEMEIELPDADDPERTRGAW